LLLSAGLYHVLKKRKILQENKQTDVKENLLDENKNPANENGNPPDENKNPANENENPPDENKNPADENGNPANENENPPDENKNPPDENENPANENGNPPDENGNPVTNENENPVTDENKQDDENENKNQENGNVKTDIVENENQENVSDEEFNKLLNKMGEIKNLFDKIVSTNIKEKDIKEFKEKCEKFHQYYSEDFQKIFKGINDNKKDKDKVVHLLIIYCCTDAAMLEPRNLLKKFKPANKRFLPDNKQIGKERNYFKKQIIEHEKIIANNKLLKKLFGDMIKKMENKQKNEK
jgi:hypothetical protein